MLEYVGYSDQDIAKRTTTVHEILLVHSRMMAKLKRAVASSLASIGLSS